MCMLNEMQAKRDEIYAIARAYKTEKFWAVGSCALDCSSLGYMNDLRRRA